MTEHQKPVVAVTVGDPAGVGPEIVVKALANQTVWDACLPVVVGDLEVVKRAAKMVGVEHNFHSVTPDDLGTGSGEIPVLDIQAGGERAEIGKISAEGGRAAFEAIRRAVELCLEGKATALATAPINKESLRLAKVPYLDPHRGAEETHECGLCVHTLCHGHAASVLLHAAPAVSRNR